MNVKASLHLADATIAETLMLYETELASSLRAPAEYRELADNAGIAQSLAFAAHASFYLRRHTEAQTLIYEAVAVAGTLEGSSRVVLAYAARVAARDAGADIETARHLFAQALEIYDRFGEMTNVAYSLLDLGACEFRAGNAQRALYYAEDALPRVVHLQRTCHAAWYALNDMSLYLSALSRWEDAIMRSRESIRLAREWQWDALVAFALENLVASAALRQLAATPKARESYADVASIIGFVDARLAHSGSIRDSIMQPRYDQLIRLLREKLGDDLAELRAEGAAMTGDEAVEKALAL